MFLNNADCLSQLPSLVRYEKGLKVWWTTLSANHIRSRTHCVEQIWYILYLTSLSLLLEEFVLLSCILILTLPTENRNLETNVPQLIAVSTTMLFCGFQFCMVSACGPYVSLVVLCNQPSLSKFILLNQKFHVRMKKENLHISTLLKYLLHFFRE